MLNYMKKLSSLPNNIYHHFILIIFTIILQYTLLNYMKKLSSLPNNIHHHFTV